MFGLVPTNDRVKKWIRAHSLFLNSMSGVPGRYYTDNRIEDLKDLCLEILEERCRDL